MAKYIILETRRTQTDKENFILDGTQISEEKNCCILHWDITNAYPNIYIEKLHRDTLYEYPMIKDYEKYKTDEIKIRYDLTFNYHGDYDMSYNDFITAIRIINKFNTMHQDEYIICELETFHQPMEKIYLTNNLIYVTNYGKIINIGTLDNHVIMYNLDWKIDEEYYGTIYNMQQDIITKEEIFMNLCSFIERIKKVELGEYLDTIIYIENINNLILSYV